MAKTVTEEVMSQAAPKTNPMEEMVEVFVPRMHGEDPNVYVCVNGRDYLFARGKRAMVPKPVAAIIEDSQAARERMFDHLENLEETNNQVLGYM